MSEEATEIEEEVDDDLMLDLSDLAPPRQMVTLPDGETQVSMVDPKELSLYDRARIMEPLERMMKLAEETSSGKVSKKKAADLERSMRDLTACILPEITDEQLATLKPFHLDQVTGRFLVLYGDMMTKVANAMGSKIPLTKLAGATPAS